MTKNLFQQNDIQRFKAASFLPPPRLHLQEADEIEFLKTSVAEALFYFFSNQCEKISDSHIDNVNALFVAAKKNAGAFMVPVTALNSIEAVRSESLDVIKENLAQLIAECRDEKFAINLLEAAVTNNLSLISPFSDNRAYCNESYEVESELTCLRFTDGNRCFFLIQYVSSADGMYFPEENVLVCLAHLKQIHVTRLQNKLLKLFPGVIDYAKSTNGFFGAIASHSRPGHFYYDIWPVLTEISRRPDIYEKLPHLIMRKDHDFNDMNLLFENSQSLILDTNQIDEINLNKKKWLVHIGTNRQHHLHNFYYETTDRCLVDKVVNSPTDLALEKATQVEGCYPLVWVGIEGQKRCWLEQVEGYAYILNQLATRYPKLGVVIDGWTLPFTSSEKSLKEVNKDLQVAGKILNALNPAIKHVLVIGENSNTKIFVGNKVDFFISNFATGSLYISRILGKPGFCHLSGELASVSLRLGVQIHPNNNVYLLPKKYVVDEHHIGFSFFKTLKNRTVDAICSLMLQKQRSEKMDIGHLSYSIDKNAFYQFIGQRLDKVLTNAQKEESRFFMEIAFSVHPVMRQYLKMAAQGNLIQVFPALKFAKKIEDLGGFPKSYLYRNIIYGAFKFGVHRKLDLAASYMTWLCHPLQRLKLHAMQAAKNAAHNKQPSDMDYLLKAGHKGLDNYYTRMMSGQDVPFGKCTEAMLSKAIDNLNRHFIFIGINERPAQSFDWLCKLMDWDRALFPDELPNKFQVDETLFSDETLQKAQELVCYDLRLYETALTILRTNTQRVIC